MKQMFDLTKLGKINKVAIGASLGYTTADDNVRHIKNWGRVKGINGEDIEAFILGETEQLEAGSVVEYPVIAVLTGSIEDGMSVVCTPHECIPMYTSDKIREELKDEVKNCIIMMASFK